MAPGYLSLWRETNEAKDGHMCEDMAPCEFARGWKGVLREATPAFWLLGLTSWWTLPVCLINLWIHPFWEYVLSYMPFAVLWGSALLVSTFVVVKGLRGNVWARLTRLGRILEVLGLYVLSLVLTVVASVILTSQGLLIYNFGGEPESGFEPLAVPTVILYVICGFLWWLAGVLDGAIRNARKRRG